MNIYQKRHAVLARHVGKWIAPAQLKAEVLRTFPGTNPSSVNSADCFYTATKSAGCTCGECTKLGGFAVNRDGIVDMGTSGFGEISPNYIPSGSTRGSPYSPATGAIPVQAAVSVAGAFLRISPDDAAEYVREYNLSSYRGRSNTALDREAYALFRGGISRDAPRMIEQIAFVGEQYGGAQERFGSIQAEAALLASNLHPILDEWLKVAREAKPLCERVPDQVTLDFLFSPFAGTKQWPVWASKTLHFVRPDVFPILDSNAKKPLGMKNLVNSSVGYRQFCSSFRDVLLANRDALTSARTADGDESPTDLKLLDKILFELGLRMK